MCVKKFDINCILAIMIRNLKNISFALLLILSSNTSLKGQSLDVQFDYCQFTSSDNLCFVETYLSVDGNSTKFKKTENGNFQSKIEVEFIFSDSNNEIKKVDKYNLYQIFLRTYTLYFKNILYLPTQVGEMAEWSNAVVLKTIVQQCTGGSNPSLSAKTEIIL